VLTTGGLVVVVVLTTPHTKTTEVDAVVVEVVLLPTL
jgi:hypothetical protein